MIVKYNKRIILWTLLLCLAIPPVMAGIGDDEDDALVYVPGSVPFSHRIFSCLRTEDEQNLLAVSSLKQSVLEQIAAGSPEIRYAAALKLAYSKTPAKREKGAKALRGIAAEDGNPKQVSAAIALVERGEKGCSVWRVVSQSAENPKDNSHWKAATLTLLRNKDHADDGRGAVTAALTYLEGMKKDDTHGRNKRREQLVKDIKDVLAVLAKSKLPENKIFAEGLKKTDKVTQLYGLGEKIKEKITPKKSN